MTGEQIKPVKGNLSRKLARLYAALNVASCQFYWFVANLSASCHKFVNIIKLQTVCQNQAYFKLSFADLL